MYAVCKKITDFVLFFSSPEMQFGDSTTQLLYNFEETCMEDYLRQENIKGQYSIEGTMQRIGDR